jgi:hypothetical protein
MNEVNNRKLTVREDAVHIGGAVFELLDGEQKTTCYFSGCVGGDIHLNIQPSGGHPRNILLPHIKQTPTIEIDSCKIELVIAEKTQDAIKLSGKIIEVRRS